MSSRQTPEIIMGYTKVRVVRIFMLPGIDPNYEREDMKVTEWVSLAKNKNDTIDTIMKNFEAFIPMIRSSYKRISLSDNLT